MINILPPEVYNRIAAGEVVDRPYSVVKELVENAIDAGATEITVEAEGGGKKLIRVTDNGSGIRKEDLKAAFLPHATSKLKTADDLAAIFTLGFRGEAVASVASVSKTTILSRAKGEEAYSLTVEGGVFSEISPAGGAEGTVVTVENLFFNTPARLKFLKSDASEEGDITAIMARFLLSRPEISFTYLVNGKVRYRSFGDGLESALAVVYGAGTLQNCISIRAEKHGMRLWGYIGSRAYNKPNRSYQSLFLNGRYIVNQTVALAVTNAYGSYLMKRQYPFYVLFLEVPPEVVDVNVHPNKADVRFADNRIVYGTVYSVVSAVLDGSFAALEYISPAVCSTAGKNKGAVSPLPEAPERAPAAQPVTAASAKSALPETPAFQAIPESAQAISPAPAFKASPASAPNPAEPNPAANPAPRMSVEEAKKELAFEIPKLYGRERVRALEEEKPNTFEVRSPLASSRPAPQEEQEDAFEENKKYLLEREKQASSAAYCLKRTSSSNAAMRRTLSISTRRTSGSSTKSSRKSAKRARRSPSPCSCPISLPSTRRNFPSSPRSLKRSAPSGSRSTNSAARPSKCLRSRSISSAWISRRSSAKCSPRWNRSAPSAFLISPAINSPRWRAKRRSRVANGSRKRRQSGCFRIWTAIWA